MAEGILWFIDENPDQRRTFADKLSKLFPSFEVKPIAPLRSLTDYFRMILDDADTRCVIIDNILSNKGTAKYLGISVAVELRSVDPNMPIYILTNYPESDDLVQDGWSVEDVISKGDLTKLRSPQAEAVKARMARRMGGHSQLVNERAQRINDLLKKSADGVITNSELNEYRALQLEPNTVLAAIEIPKLIDIEEKRANLHDLIDRLDTLLGVDDEAND